MLWSVSGQDAMVTLLLFVGGLLLLVAGAELLVRGASRIAALAGISPLVVGLTVVAFGTSAPELAVSSVASLRGDADIAVGNVVGRTSSTCSSSWAPPRWWRPSPSRDSSSGSRSR